MDRDRNFGAHDGLALLRAYHADDMNTVNEIVTAMTPQELMDTVGGVLCLAAIYADGVAGRMGVDINEVFDQTQAALR